MAACRIRSLPQRHAVGEGLWKTASCGNVRGGVLLLAAAAARHGGHHTGCSGRVPLRSSAPSATGIEGIVCLEGAGRAAVDPPRRPVLERFLAIAPTQLAARVLRCCCERQCLHRTVAHCTVACVSATRPTNQCAMQIDPIPVRSRLIFYRGSRIAASLFHY